MKNCEFRFFANDMELARAAAKEWLQLVSKRFPNGHTVALSGGRIAAAFFTAIVEEAKNLGARLDQVHFYWADERCVPPEDADSNFRLANEHLFQPAAIALDHIHRIKGELDPAKATELANGDLAALPLGSNGLPSFDMIFLGIGPDGHIASLMPNAPSDIAERRGPYLFVPDSPKPPPRRITLSYEVIWGAKNVWALVTGEGKEKALHDSLRPGAHTPFGRILEGRKETEIFSSTPLT